MKLNQPKITPTIYKVRESATLRINQLVKNKRVAGEEICHFGFGESPFNPHPLIMEALQKNSHHKLYLPSLGLPELRECIASFYQKYFCYHYSPENIAIGPGSKELIFDLLFLLEGCLLLPSPSWVSYEPQARILGKQVTPIPSDASSGYKIKAETLESLADSSEQNILILNSPNNPSGHVFTNQEQEEIAEVCDKKNIIVISDEIYSHMIYDGKPKPGLHALIPDKVIVTGGLSKNFSAGGYRLGFAMIPQNMSELTKTLSVLISETFSCVSAPIQHAAVAAYADYPEIMQYVKDCATILGRASEAVREKITEGVFDCLPSQGGFYLFPSIAKKYLSALNKAGYDSSQTLALDFLQKASVAVLPGEDFGMEKETFHFRMATVDFDGPASMEAFLNSGRSSSSLSPYFKKMLKGVDRLDYFFKNYIEK